MYDLLHHYVSEASRAMLWFIIVALSAFIITGAVKIIYNLFIHPLRHFPGPWLEAATPFPYVYRLWTGRMPEWTDELHLKYGNVVRIHPDELSFVESSAWSDIYQNRPQLPKPEIGAFKPENGVRPIASITRTDDHTRQRRILNPAFSERAVKQQEYIVQNYVDLLIKRLGEVSKNGNELDICNWYMFTTLDIISDLSFGKSFNCLDSGDYNPWLNPIFNSVKIARIFVSFTYLPPLDKILWYLAPTSLKEKREQHVAHGVKWIDERIAQQTDRPDIMKLILENNHAKGMTRPEIDSTVMFLIFAGSETSASTMTSSTWFSLTHPDVWRRLSKEIRDAFSKYEDIDIASTSTLPYLHAVIQESMRLHPLTPTAVPRVVDRPDVTVSGIPIPMGTRVGIPQKTAYRLPTNYANPRSFVPERWLPEADPMYDGDDADIFHPFLVGPRNCIGQTYGVTLFLAQNVDEIVADGVDRLAWAEIKLVLCKVIWSFDIELTANNGDWADQKIYLLHEKKDLNVRLTPTGLP